MKEWKWDGSFDNYVNLLKYLNKLALNGVEPPEIKILLEPAGSETRNVYHVFYFHDIKIPVH